MAAPWQARVETRLPHLLCPRHEEVDGGVGDHAVGESIDGVVVAFPDVQAVAILTSFFHGHGVTVCGGVARHFSHCAADLQPSERHKINTDETTEKLIIFSEQQMYFYPKKVKRMIVAQLPLLRNKMAILQ